MENMLDFKRQECETIRWIYSTKAPKGCCVPKYYYHYIGALKSLLARYAQYCCRDNVLVYLSHAIERCASDALKLISLLNTLLELLHGYNEVLKRREAYSSVECSDIDYLYLERFSDTYEEIQGLFIELKMFGSVSVEKLQSLAKNDFDKVVTAILHCIDYLDTSVDYMDEIDQEVLKHTSLTKKEYYKYIALNKIEREAFDNIRHGYHDTKPFLGYINSDYLTPQSLIKSYSNRLHTLGISLFFGFSQTHSLNCYITTLKSLICSLYNRLKQLYGNKTTVDFYQVINEAESDNETFRGNKDGFIARIEDLLLFYGNLVKCVEYYTKKDFVKNNERQYLENAINALKFMEVSIDE